MNNEPILLPPRVEVRRWADGVTVTYRYKPKQGRAVWLGTDYESAMEKYRQVSGPGRVVTLLDGNLLAETWKRHQKGAKQRRISFSLTQEDIAFLADRQGQRCAVTRLPFSTSKPAGLRVRPWLPSLDRKDPSRGYELKNVRLVCAFVNVAMNGFGETLFRQVLEPLVSQVVQERLEALGIPTTGTPTWEPGGNPLREIPCAPQEGAIRINELGGVADRTRTGDDQNHNLGPESSIHAGCSEDEGNSCD